VGASSREIEAGDLTFSCRETGIGGEPVLLLHGFPETSRMWEPMMTLLADAGYHCLAPDQRGYSPAARPGAVEAYAYEHLAGDVLAIAAAAGFDRYHVIAHDWGACVTWGALSVDASPISSYVAMSIPHYLAFARAVWEDPDEELYRGFLEFFIGDDPAAESVLAADDFAALRSGWTAHDGAEIEAYLSVFRQPSALTGALNWYRATDAHRCALVDGSFPFGKVGTPTLLIWGRDDPYVRRMSVDSATEYMTGPYGVLELDAGHWLVQEEFQAVAQAVVEHLATYRNR
jgi:pimeloyl-ACP methyl ester carboxylesterase